MAPTEEQVARPLRRPITEGQRVYNGLRCTASGPYSLSTASSDGSMPGKPSVSTASTGVLRKALKTAGPVLRFSEHLEGPPSRWAASVPRPWHRRGLQPAPVMTPKLRTQTNRGKRPGNVPRTHSAVDPGRVRAQGRQSREELSIPSDASTPPVSRAMAPPSTNTLQEHVDSARSVASSSKSRSRLCSATCVAT